MGVPPIGPVRTGRDARATWRCGRGIRRLAEIGLPPFRDAAWLLGESKRLLTVPVEEKAGGARIALRQRLRSARGGRRDALRYGKPEACATQRRPSPTGNSVQEFRSE